MGRLHKRPRAATLSSVTNTALPFARPSPPHERIVQAARDLFCRQGIHATGIDRILAAASASKMALYGRFGSKEALLREVLAREGADWRKAFFSAMEAAGPDPLAKLRAPAAAMKLWYQGGRFYGCAFMNAIGEHDKEEQWLREIAADHHAQVLAFLHRLAQEAKLAEPAIVARQILLLIDGAAAALMVTKDAGVLTIMARNMDAVLATANRLSSNQTAGDAAISRSLGSQP